VENRAAGQEVLRLQTSPGLATALLDGAWYGLGPDYPWRRPAEIEAVTPEQVNDAARRLLHPDQMVVSVAKPG
jgi:predicted Zn-dependent peptidase